MTTAAIRHSFSYTLDYLREQVADVSEADMVAQPAGAPNHPAWVIGHLTFVCEMLGGAIGVGSWLPEGWAKCYGPGSLPGNDVSFYESKEQALAVLGDAQSRISAAVEHLSDSQLGAPFPDEVYRDIFPTIRHALAQVLIGHTAFHVGQVSVWRRAMGLAPMRRSYE